MADSIAFGLKSFSVSNPLHKSEPLLDAVSCYVERGGITAILGASGSGKSLLLQAVTARMQDLDLSGDCFMNCVKINPKGATNPVAFVPQDDSLIGDLTAREVVLTTALLKRKEPRDELDAHVMSLLKDLGLGHVADTVVGTIIFRGLSGGQRKRAEVATELIASPSILILDEPTSGLDSSVAFEVLSRIRQVVKNSGGRMSVVLSIHQPNSKMLPMFDHLLLLEKGKSIFFGSLPEAVTHFSVLGCECPPGVTPTDYFLQVSDTNFSFGADAVDFAKAYRDSTNYATLTKLMEDHAAFCVEKEKASGGTTEKLSINVNQVNFWYQVYVLIRREFTLAYRDPFLYYFQFILMLSFAMMVGAVFWELPHEVDGNFGRISGALLWIVMPCCWVHAFKVYYLNSSTKRAEHEMLNAKYTPMAVMLADTISTAILTCVFLPQVPLCMLMMGFPMESAGMVVLCCWLILQAAESMIALVTKLSPSATTGMIFAQICLVNLQVFGAGVFIPWKDCPSYWLWLQEITVFCQGSRIVMLSVYDHMTLKCAMDGSGACVEPGTGNIYDCVSYNSDGVTCEVEARQVLSATQGVRTDTSIWGFFAALAAIFVCLKLGVAFLTYFPINRVQYFVTSKVSSPQRSTETTSTKAVKPNETDEANVEKYSQIPKDSIAVGSSEGSAKPGNVDTLSWVDFSVILPKSGKKLVNNVSGFVKSGRICGLMGPSGAGKTTLLNGLADRASYANLEGSVCFVDRVMTSNDLTYVPQFDEVNDVMTIREHLLLVGRLTCADEDEVLRRADEILDVLGLTDRQNTRVAMLSGGEIKRVSIGVGLISKPNVLFLDEPTTGLDSTAAFSIVQYLAKVAKSMNIAVIMTIHQPSALVFDMIDDLFLLEMGNLVFGGSLADANAYFASIGLTNPEKINPADYFLDLIQSDPTPEVLEQAKTALTSSGVASAQNISTWSDIFSLSQFGVQYLEDLRAAKAQPATVRSKKVIPSLPKQFLIMCIHFFHYFKADPGYVRYVCYSLAVIAVFNSTIFLQLEPETKEIGTYTGAMFTTAVAVMLSAVSSTALFARDRREAVDRIKNGYYHPGVYVWSQFVVSIAYKLVATVIFVCIYHWAVNLNPTLECFLFNLCITWGHLILMDAVLMVFIEVIKNAFLCTTAGMIFIGTNMLFAGFFRPQTDIPPAISWFSYVVPMYWSFRGFSWQIFSTQDFDITGTSPVQEMSGKEILDYFFDLRDINSWGMFGILMAYVIFFRINQHFLLAFQTGPRRLPRFSLPSFGGAESEESDVSPVSSGDQGYQKTAANEDEGAQKSTEMVAVADNTDPEKNV